MTQDGSPRTFERTRRLTQRIWSFCDVLRDDGITYQDYISELSWLLFIFTCEHRGVSNDALPDLPTGLRWSDLRDTESPYRLQFYREQLDRLSRVSNDATSTIFTDARTAISSPAAFSRLIEAIDSLELSKTDGETLGDIYEGLLERNATEQRSGAGQYFTPRFLVDLIVRAVDPQPGDVIQDPAAGTGGFLISAARYLQSQAGVGGLASTRFIGAEIVRSAYRLGQMNLFLHGMTGEFHLADTLTIAGQQLGLADVILSNPPFGAKRGAGTVNRVDFSYETSNKQLAFLQHIYRALKPSGRAGIIVPDNVLFDNGVGRNIRKELYEHCRIDCILRLPPGLFYAAGVRTNVLLITRLDKRQDQPSPDGLWIFDARANVAVTRGGISLSLQEALEEFETFYRLSTGDRHLVVENSDNIRARYISHSEVEDRQFDFDISSPPASLASNEELLDPLTLLRRAHDELGELVIQTGALLSEISEELADD